jgi:hypothetical protein
MYHIFLKILSDLHGLLGLCKLLSTQKLLGDAFKELLILQLIYLLFLFFILLLFYYGRI